MPERAALTINGVRVDWTELELSASMEAASRGLQAKWPLTGDWPIPRPGARVGGLMVGFVDRVTAHHGANGYTVAISAREIAADLIDGSPVDAPAEWADASLLDIARDLAGRVGVEVVDESDGAALEPFLIASAQPGDSALGTIERLARERALLLRIDERSKLVFYRPGAYPWGGRLSLAGRDWTLTLDGTERFRTWVVRGQATFSKSGDAALAPEGRATDQGARASRAQLILAQGSVDSDQCDALAAWHAAVSAARAEVLEVQWPGWGGEDGDPDWQPGTLFDLSGPFGAPAGKRLLAHVTRSADSGGFSTRLGFVRPDAYTVGPTVPGLDALVGLEALL